MSKMSTFATNMAIFIRMLCSLVAFTAEGSQFPAFTILQDTR